MSPIGAVHFVSALVAILAGAVVMLLDKGTRWHRTWGHAYVWSMVAVVATSFSMYQMTGRVTPFHLAAVVGGVTILAGLRSVLLRTPRGEWLEPHAYWMAWSYVGLMAAFSAETLTRFVMPAVAPRLEAMQAWGAFWVVVAGASFATGAVGWWLIKTRLPATVKGTPAAMRRDRQELEHREAPEGMQNREELSLPGLPPG